jgi:hypothetical protein
MSNPGASEIGSRRKKDWVLLRSYVFADAPPAKVDVKKHLLDYVGAVKSKKHLTGIYGTNSGDAGGFLATNWARRNDMRTFFLDIWAEIPNFHSSRAQMTRDILAESHWLHLDRMSVSLRDEIKAKMLGWIKRKEGERKFIEAEDMSCQQIALRYPEFAVKLLDEDLDIGMIVHPVYTKFDLESERQLSLWAATVHTERIAIKGAELRHMGDVQCIL